MKILYGLAGEGFGHSSRAREIIPYLKKKGHKVKVVTYGQAVSVLKKEGFDVFKIKGMHMEFEQGKLNHKETIVNSLKNFLSNINKSGDIRKLMKEKFDLCISDMEPLVAMLSNWYHLPLLSIDNQHRLTNLELKVPTKYLLDHLTAKFIVNLFVSAADWYVITSFSKAKIKQKYKSKTFIVPPIVRGKVRRLKPKSKNYILVYLTKKDERVLKILKSFNENFVVYGYDAERKDKNLRFHRAGDGFLKDLAECKAIIASAGFTLISESLYLKKPYFALPLKGQFEQVLNALFLRQSGFGDYSDEPDKEKTKNFLNNLGKYKKNLARYNPNYDLLFNILDKVLRKVKVYKAKRN
jgi:uncharacterized protein (TIGR00661 family)